MNNCVKVRLLTFFIFLFFCVQAQEYYTGCIIDDEAYNAIPLKKENLSRDYKILPSSCSLKQYCPTPRWQGDYGTCTGWATAYAARTISEAVVNGWTDNEQITSEAFSPLFIYIKLKDKYDDCKSGASIEKTLEVMKKEGIAKFRNLDASCASSVPEAAMREASKNKINGYFTLFENKETVSSKVKIDETKKAISQNNPVIISMKIHASFYKSKDIWDGVTDGSNNYHAMCVIGYDDKKYGGAFQIMNSWGEDWGEGGFTWVKYKDYSENTRCAYVMDVRKNSAATVETVSLEGSLQFILYTGEEMIPKLYSNNTIPYYQMKNNYISGTRYRIYLSNNVPAYVYVIGSDLQNSTSIIFPPDNKISPALTYKSNNIAIPDENWYIEMDYTIGIDYVCVLFSENELPVNNIVKKIKDGSGNFYDKIKYALSSDIVPAKNINYSKNNISFDISGTKKTVVPLIVEILHK